MVVRVAAIQGSNWTHPLGRESNGSFDSLGFSSKSSIGSAGAGFSWLFLGCSFFSIFLSFLPPSCNSNAICIVQLYHINKRTTHYTNRPCPKLCHNRNLIIIIVNWWCLVICLLLFIYFEVFFKKNVHSTRSLCLEVTIE